VGKSFFFLGLAPSRRDEQYVTKGDNYLVHGGTSKEDHQRMAEITHEVSKECKKDAPQTQGEFNMIVQDAIKKVSPSADQQEKR